MNRIVECVPNFSEGRDKQIIDDIAHAIRTVDNVKLLHIDMGAAANRTVITFAGTPEAVCEAAFRAVKKASELIDMSRQHGEHPRIGATDVLPIVPISGITLEECAQLARTLSKRIFEELSIPVYCYEASSFKPAHHNLEDCRKGEYEALAQKISDPESRPDFCDGIMTEQAVRSGASVVGARSFLIAVNFNLDTDNVEKAKAIAGDVRSRGRAKRKGDKYNGIMEKDNAGKTIMIPGKLKGVKAIGWFIEEYGIAQVSMNITDIEKTPLYLAFNEVCTSAKQHGCNVTGTEIIGLVPKKVLVESGRFFYDKQLSTNTESLSEAELINIAVCKMHLDDLKPFDPKEKIIEYKLEK